MIAATLMLSLLEIILLFFGAVILGITIHFFISSRRGFSAVREAMEKNDMVKDEWKLRYFNDTEMKDKEIAVLKQQMKELEENSAIYEMEAEETRKENKLLKSEKEKTVVAPQQNAAYEATIEELRRRNSQLQEELEIASRTTVSHQAHETDKPDYLDQLRQAQTSLLEHNQKINQLLGNIDVIKEKEEKEREILHDKEVLAAELDYVRETLSEKEKEIHTIRQKEHLTKEMTTMLDSAYNEFGVLQEKIQKLETQLNSSQLVSLELEDLKEEHLKVIHDRDEQRMKMLALNTEMQQLTLQLSETEDKLREATFQRQQLQKKVAFLEELNNDLQVVSDTNKKLEGQLRRVGELESMLNMVSEERDQLAQRQGNR